MTEFLYTRERNVMNFENWVSTERREIDHQRIFDSGYTVGYYSGKAYLVSRPFAEFISQNGSGTALKHVE